MYTINKIGEEVMKVWGDKIIAASQKGNKHAPVIDLELTSVTYADFNSDILDMMTTTIVVDETTGHAAILTDKVQWRLYNLNIMILKVTNTNARRNTARLGDKTICIDFP